MENKSKLKQISGKPNYTWKDKLNFKKNNPWLREYSSQIARRILAIIRHDKNLSQNKLAETLNVSPQQISKIVKGQENLTLETIYKLSKALDYELISFPDYKYSYTYSLVKNTLNETTVVTAKAISFESHYFQSNGFLMSKISSAKHLSRQSNDFIVLDTQQTIFIPLKSNKTE